MTTLALAVLGVLSPLLLPVVLPASAGWTACFAGLSTLGFRRLRPAAAFLLPLAYSLLSIDANLADRLAPELHNTELQAEGVIDSMPLQRGDYAEFMFRPAEGPGNLRLPDKIRVRWYTDFPELHAGEKWRLQLRLRPSRSRVNFSGPDTERYFFAERIGALATVSGSAGTRLEQSSGKQIERIREILRWRISRVLDGHPGKGVVLALAIADRSELTREHRQNLSATGTGHLLAISGLHIGLAALFGFWCGRGLGGLLPSRWRLRNAHLPAWACALLLAGCYAALAGFGTSTQRALIMLGVLSIAQLTRRAVHPYRSLLLALVLVLLVDPMTPLRAGFWFSFTAVAVLVHLFAARTGRRGRLRSLLMAQAGITLVMLPLGMYWFQRGTLLGMAANLGAIPVVGFVVVPLVLTGALLQLLNLPGADFFLLLAADACRHLVAALARLAEFAAAGSVTTARPGVLPLLLALAGVCIVLLPRGLNIRWLATFMIVPALLPDPAQLPRGNTRLELLDVGQGLAAMVTTSEHLLLYDSGPGQPGHWDMVDSVVAPAIASAGLGPPDRVVISHGDLDHAGGLDAVLTRFPRADVHGNISAERLQCNTKLQWRWDDVDFRVLHPGPGLPYIGNASSCVLSLEGPLGGMLLTGDIDAAVEARLTAGGIGRYPVLVAPHHGSRTSSTQGFVDRLKPDLVLFSAAADNRFGFPAAEVTRRYLHAGAITVSTADCGAIRVEFSGYELPAISTARRARPALWRWPPAPHCP